jgi:hypothetical protein
MKLARTSRMQTALVFSSILYFCLMAGAQTGNIPARITQPVNAANLVTLHGNIHPLARPQYDQGAAPDGEALERMLLVLQRSPQQEAALRNLLDEQQAKSSPNYHMWLTPEEFGQQFGPADADIQTLTGWLASQGFEVTQVAAGRTVIEFSGTAGELRQAFHTAIHKYAVNGGEYWANSSDPQIPAALAPVVAGFASLNNFPKRPMLRRLGTFSKSKATRQMRPLFSYPVSCPSGVGSCYDTAVGPTDFATIYNVLPLWNGSPAIDGTGQTIAVAEQTDINPQDVTDFRTMFGLSTSGNFLQTIHNGPDPGILTTTGDEGEADVDAQWAGAIAKGATVDLVVSQSTDVTEGIDLSALYIVDNNLTPIMSYSYGNCEAALGNSGNAFYSGMWEQGAAQGITILIAAGDSGSAACDGGEIAAQYGSNVTGQASTPFNVAVGGMDFNDVNTQPQYWNTTNGAGQSSAMSYIPEMPWNDSCAATSTATLNNCTTARISSDPFGVDLAAGGGGPSNCAASSSVTGSCTGAYAKPAWQGGVGVPPDSVRDVPDVALFAADGYISGAFYIYCERDANASSTPPGSSTSCDLNSPYTDFQGGGGTSFAAPAFAGIIAMVNQKTGQRQGNANYVLYPFAAAAAKNGTYCTSNAAAVSDSACVFYDVPAGFNNSVACEAGGYDYNCSNQTSGGIGFLEVDSISNAYLTAVGNFAGYNASGPAWPTTAGYDMATGLGSVNAANLVNGWSAEVGTFKPTTTTLKITPASFNHGASTSVSVTVSSTSGGTPTGDVGLTGGPSGYNISCGSTPCTLGNTYLTLTNGAATEPTILLPGGTYNVTANYQGDGTYGASTSSPVQVTVNPESSQTFVQLATTDCNGDITFGVTSITYGASIQCSNNALYSAYFLRMDVTNSSGALNANSGVADTCYNDPKAYQCPAGQVSLTDNSTANLGTFLLNSQGFAEDQVVQLPGGSNGLSASYTPSPASPNNSYNSSTGSATISVTPAPTTTSLSAPSSVQSGGSVTLIATVATTTSTGGSVGLAPAGTVQFLNSGTPITGNVTLAPVNGVAGGFSTFIEQGVPSTTNYASLTATLTTTSFTSLNCTPTCTVTAQYTPASSPMNYAGSTSSAATIKVTTTADFSLTVPSNQNPILITAPGAQGTATISVSPIGGFTGTINFTCSLTSTMTSSTCTFSPTSITLPGQTSTVMTVQTTAGSTVVPLFKSPRWLVPIGGAVLACLFLLIVPVKRRRLKLAFASLFLVLLAAALVACGGGGSSSSVSTSPGTPTGNYTATVTGTSGSLSNTLNVAVDVQ